MDAHDLRAKMRPHRDRLERYATPAMATLIEDMIIAAVLEPVVVPDAEAPRDEMHDSIDAGTGMLSGEALARRAELKAAENAQRAEAEKASAADTEGSGAFEREPAPPVDETALPVVAAANLELTRTPATAEV
jgi:predicted Zn-dependent protease with MMP-like domain